MAIVAAIASLADTLGFSTIAEGVETELQREALMALGVRGLRVISLLGRYGQAMLRPPSRLLPNKCLPRA